MRYLKTLFLVLLSIGMVNCSQRVEDATEDGINEDHQRIEGSIEETPPPLDEGPPEEVRGRFGALATLTPSSDFVLGDYLGGPVNTIENLEVKANFTEVSNRFRGRVSISIEANGQDSVVATFSTGNSQEAIKYNKWLDEDNLKFHAVLEDNKLEGGGPRYCY